MFFFFCVTINVNFAIQKNHGKDMREISEEGLWQLCLDGNREAFKEMYCRFYPLLYHYGLKLISDKELVKDSIQDLFVKIMQNHATLSPTLNLKGYLLRSLRNKMIDLLEKEKPSSDLTGCEDRFAAEDLFSAEDDPNPLSRILGLSFAELSARQQEILYLYYVDDLKHEEIAEILGINYQSSKNLLFRSLSKLKSLVYSRINRYGHR